MKLEYISHCHPLSA